MYRIAISSGKLPISYGRMILHSPMSTAIARSLPELTKDHLKALGPRTVVVSTTEESHKKVAGKVWYELQKIGVQATFLNLTSRFPSRESIHDGVNLLKRTGATSIISLGTATTTDFGKAIQLAADLPGSLTTYLQDPSKLKGIGNSSLGAGVPRIAHIVLPSSATSNHFHDSCHIIHPEEDILLEIPAASPSVVAYDKDIVALSDHYSNPTITKATILSTTLDTLVAFNLLKREEEINDGGVGKLFAQVGLKAKLINAQDSTLEALAATSDLRVSLRNLLSTFSSSSMSINSLPEAWPSLLDTATMLMQTNLTVSRSLPASYIQVMAAGSLLHLTSVEERGRYVSKSDRALLAAIDAAMTTLETELSVSPSQLRQDVLDALQQIEIRVNGQPSNFSPPPMPKQSAKATKLEALTAAGHIEKVSVFLDQLSEKLQENKVILNAKKQVLRSDLLLDVLEALIESDSAR